MQVARTAPQTAVEPDDPAFWDTRRRSRRGWTITVFLLVLMMISWADKAILGIVAVPLMRDLDISPETFGLLGSAVFILFGAAQLAAAPIANRVSSTWILLALCLVWSIAQVPIFVFATLPALGFSRILLGAGEGPLAPITMHAVYKWFPSARGATPAAVAASGVTLGIVVFAPMLAWITANFGWKATFIFLAMIGVVWATLWFFIGKDGPYTSIRAEHAIEGTMPDQGEEQALQAADRKVSYWRSIGTLSWLLAVLSAFLAYWTFTVAMTWLPAYFENVMGMSTQQAGSLIALPAVWGTAATVGLSWLTGRLAARGWRSRYSRGLVLGATALFSGAMVLVGTNVQEPALAIACFTFGFGTAPSIFALTYLVFAETTTIGQRGAMLQYSNAILTSAGLFAPAVVGMLVGSASSAVVGFEHAFVLTGAMMFGSGLLSLLFINQQRDRKRLGLDV